MVAPLEVEFVVLTHKLAELLGNRGVRGLFLDLVFAEFAFFGIEPCLPIKSERVARDGSAFLVK